MTEKLRNPFLGALSTILVLLLVPVARADWNPNDPFKMHFPQEPDPAGWDVCLIDQWLADDFLCTETGPIHDIHFWYSFLEDIEGEILPLDIAIYDDAGPPSFGPGVPLWTWNGMGTVTVRPYGSGPQGFICPSTGFIQPPPDHFEFYQINIEDISEPFQQIADTTYWLVIRSQIPQPMAVPGWKTSVTQFQSPALWSTDLMNWRPIETPEMHDLAFVITSDQGQTEFEFGDAPESAPAYPAMGVIGGFPTCVTIGPSGFIQHSNFGAWFGPTFDLEFDGNAGFCPTFTPNLYDQDECFADGDAGLLIPDSFTIVGPVGAEQIVPCPQAGGAPLGVVCTQAFWGPMIDIEVHNHMPNDTVGYVNVLIDWSQDGFWGGISLCPDGSTAPEHVLVNFPIPNPFDGPLSALMPMPPSFLIGPNPGYVWARFSITEQRVPLPWTGEGVFEDGETEDYLLQIDPPVEEFDFGDLPDPPYPTLLASNGAQHFIVPGYALVPPAITPIHGHPDGQPSVLADGDDLANVDDEDGINFMTVPLIPGQQAIIDVTNNMGMGGVGYLEGWIDFNNDGSFAEAGDQVFFSQPLSPAPVNFNSFFVNVPSTATPNINAYARFRFSSNPAGYGPAGPAQDGEVEDYIVPIGEAEPTADLGDAPDSTNTTPMVPMTAYPSGGPPGVLANFPTVFVVGSPPHGPIHWQPRAVAWLGNAVTLELEADTGPDEDGGNNIVPPMDWPDMDLADDGVVFPIRFRHCQPGTFDFIVTYPPFPITPPPLYVNVWFDYNRDGDWDDSFNCPNNVTAPEWAVQNQLLMVVTSGTYTFTTLPFVPWIDPTADPSEMWMRITLAEQPWQPVAGANGFGGSGPPSGYDYGETEDYYFFPEIPPPVTRKWIQPPHDQGQGFDAASSYWWEESLPTGIAIGASAEPRSTPAAWSGHVEAKANASRPPNPPSNPADVSKDFSVTGAGQRDWVPKPPAAEANWNNDNYAVGGTLSFHTAMSGTVQGQGKAKAGLAGDGSVVVDARARVRDTNPVGGLTIGDSAYGFGLARMTPNLVLIEGPGMTVNATVHSEAYMATPHGIVTAQTSAVAGVDDDTVALPVGTPFTLVWEDRAEAKYPQLIANPGSLVVTELYVNGTVAHTGTVEMSEEPNGDPQLTATGEFSDMIFMPWTAPGPQGQWHEDGGARSHYGALFQNLVLPDGYRFIETPVNKVVADDFISDGRPIRIVRWWGSYFDERYAPDAQFDQLHVIDGWFISFHHARPDVGTQDCPPDILNDPPPTVLAIYFAPADAVHIEPLSLFDCFQERVYVYTIDLARCCLLCTEFDPRFPNAIAPPGTPDAFRERGAARYWLDIQAVVGVTWMPPNCSFDDRILTGHIPSEITPDGQFWGWHTSPANVMPQGPLAWACVGEIFDRTPYPPNCWHYGNWTKQPWLCPTQPPPQVDMSFILYADVCVPVGDLNQDSVTNALDIQCFVDCILGYTIRPCWCGCGDMNTDLVVDVTDITPFVNLLLSL